MKKGLLLIFLLLVVVLSSCENRKTEKTESPVSGQIESTFCSSESETIFIEENNTSALETTEVEPDPTETTESVDDQEKDVGQADPTDGNMIVPEDTSSNDDSNTPGKSDTTEPAETEEIPDGTDKNEEDPNKSSCELPEL